MNIQDIPSRGIITYNHHDHLYRQKYPQITDEIYEKHIRVITSAFEETKKELQRTINPESNYDRQFYFLTGYAGNGKSVFVNLFKQEIEKENYYFEIINLIESPQQMSNKHKLIMSCIIDKIKKEDFSKMRDTFLYIQDNRSIFNKAFSTQQLNAIDRIAQENQILFEEKIQNEFDNETNTFDFTKVLTLYLFHRAQQFKNDTNLNSKKSYTFCFDNLDELALEYLTDNVWLDFENAVALLYDISDKIQCSFIRQKIYFVLVFREANFACRSAQTMERINNISGNKRFIYSTEGQKILEKRQQFTEKFGIKATDDLIGLLNIMRKEDRVNTIILPLLNYDFRIFSHSLFEILDPYKKFISLSEKESEKEYDSLSEFPFGRRGIIINAYINYLAHNGFLTRITKPPINSENYQILNGGHWNKKRLVLTVFSNLSFPTGYPEREKELREISPQPFNLLEAFGELKLFLTIEEFFSILQELTDMTKFYWAHLITIYNKEPINTDNKGYYFDFSKEKLLLSQSESRTLTEHETNYLKNIKITLNASAYIYLRHIFTHFEYISAYKVNYDLNIIKPLFQCTGITPRKREEEAGMVFEFQVRIEEVYKHVEIMCQNIREYYQKHFIDNGISGEEYIKSNYIFKGDANRNVSFFATRMLSTHLQYIEKFRHYVRKNYDTIVANANSFPELKNKFSTFDKTQNYFFEYIGKYIALMHEVKDPNIGQIPNRLFEKLELAKKNPEIVIEASDNKIEN
jgi:hypothetical protein